MAALATLTTVRLTRVQMEAITTNQPIRVTWNAPVTTLRCTRFTQVSAHVKTAVNANRMVSGTFEFEGKKPVQSVGENDRKLLVAEPVL